MRQIFPELPFRNRQSDDCVRQDNKRETPSGIHLAVFLFAHESTLAACALSSALTSHLIGISLVSMSNSGIVYILINEAMPGYVKIGKTTTSIERRILELSRSSAVPLPFECYYAARVSDVSRVEAAFHDAFGDHRVNPRREFFNISPERVVAILKLLAVEEIILTRNIGIETHEDAVAVDRAKKRRSAFNFEMANIPAGAELKFIRDESVVCVVAPDRKHVVFRGIQLSVSAAAQRALGVDWPATGPLYWKYNNELLDERRDRLEESGLTDETIPEAGDSWMQLQGEISKGK